MRRLMALDVGDRRIGVAVSDPLALFAQPLLAIDRQAVSGATAVAALLREWEIERVVVGLPLLPSGDRGQQAEAVLTFVRDLETVVEVPIELWDESFTTLAATARLAGAAGGARRGSGGAHGAVARERERGRIDAVAAAVILEEWLSENGDRYRHGAEVRDGSIE